jgi:hypothetical protein
MRCAIATSKGSLVAKLSGVGTVAYVAGFLDQRAIGTLIALGWEPGLER